jgi:hypothetical protein
MIMEETIVEKYTRKGEIDNVDVTSVFERRTGGTPMFVQITMAGKGSNVFHAHANFNAANSDFSLHVSNIQFAGVAYDIAIAQIEGIIEEFSGGEATE